MTQDETLNPTRYVAAEGFVARVIAGEMLLVPVGEQTQRLNGMITFNETGAFLYSLLAQPRTRESLVLHLADASGVKAEDVQEDVDTYLQAALARGFVTVAD